MTVKYIVFGLILNSSHRIVPVLLMAILSAMAFFLLVRFQGYVRSLSTSYDNQLEGIVKGVIATLGVKRSIYTRT